MRNLQRQRFAGPRDGVIPASLMGHGAPAARKFELHVATQRPRRSSIEVKKAQSEARICEKSVFVEVKLQSATQARRSLALSINQLDDEAGRSWFEAIGSKRQADDTV